jgi:hypothetical protein
MRRALQEWQTSRPLHEKAARRSAVHASQRMRAKPLAALDQVQPGGTILFAPGTYLVGELIRVTVPGVTLQGHPDGTTLRL